jgi:hypothetical protein
VRLQGKLGLRWYRTGREQKQNSEHQMSHFEDLGLSDCINHKTFRSPLQELFLQGSTI